MGKLSTQRYATGCILVLSSIVTAWFFWATSISPRIRRVPWEVLLGQSLRQILLDWACGAAIAGCVYLTIWWTSPGGVRHPRRTVILGVWFALAMILMSAASPIAIVAGSVVVFSTTRLMTRRLDSRRAMPFEITGVLFWKRLVAAVVCSLAIHASLLAFARGSALLSAALLALSIAIVTSLAMVVGAYIPARPASVPHSVMSLLLILIVTAGLMLNRQGGVGSTGSGETGEESLFADNFPGVILLRELEKNAVLIAPSMTKDSQLTADGRRRAKKSKTELTEPLDIAFSGEYWMFLPRYRRPPPKSLIRRGNPAKLSFATDGGPMIMEAHQPLISPLDPTSLRNVQLVISGPDTRNPFALELFLVDTEKFDPRGGESLGQQLTRGNGSADSRETIVFPVPAAPRLKQFNEIKVALRRRGLMNKSVKIEIDRMLIVPR